MKIYLLIALIIGLVFSAAKFALSQNDTAPDKDGQNLNNQPLTKNDIYELSYTGNIESVTVMLEKDPGLINKKDAAFKMTPLHWAASGGKTKMIEFLILKGADLNATDDDGFTPLHIAAQWNRKDAAQCLIQHGANINAKNNFGSTPMKIAVELGNNGLVEIFQRSGAKE